MRVNDCVTLVQLRQMTEPFRIRGLQHQIGVHTADFEPVRHRAMMAEVLIHTRNPFLGYPLLNQIHREHAPAFAATEGSVERIVIEDCQIAGVRL